MNQPLPTKRIGYIVVACLCFFLKSNFSYSQNSSDVVVDIIAEPISFSELVTSIESKHDLKFYFQSEWLKSFSIQTNEKKTLAELLPSALKANGLNAIFRDHYVIVVPDESYTDFLEEIRSLNSEDALIEVGERTPFSDNKVAKVTGKLVDGKNGEALFGATIYFEEAGIGTTTAAGGVFSIELEPGIYSFIADNVGYEPTKRKAIINGDGEMSIDLFESSVELQEVYVTAQREDANVSANNIGVSTLDVKTIKKIPAFLGEADIIKTLLYLPGVSTVGEGNSGFNVRGGKTDQNLFLFDNTPVFNSSHLFGFFTNINPDAVKDVTLYKGSVPAKYGGRISSVLDITSKEPSTDRLKVRGGVGALSSKVTAEVPIVKNKSAILLGGRVAYVNWLLNSFNDLDIKNSEANFYDVNGNWTSYLGTKDRLTVSGYLSSDRFKFAADTAYSWQTRNIGVEWNHFFNDKLSVEVSAISGTYDFDIEGLVQSREYVFNSGISQQSLLSEVTFNPSLSHSLSFGGSFSTYDVGRGEWELPTNSILITEDIDSEQNREVALYLSDEWTVSDQISISVGVRYVNFQNLGNSTVFEYTEGQPRNSLTLIDSTSFGDGDEVINYGGLEPRIGLKYSLGIASSIKASYNRHQQFIHTLTNTTGITPIDIWKSSDFYLPQEISDQFSIGYFKNFKQNAYETSVEIYYRDIDNVIDFKNGASILLNKNVEQDILIGTGRAYGVEFYAKKNVGKLTGWWSYTYSRTEKRIQSQFEEETINDGNFFPAEYDKPHNLAVVGSYQFNKRWSANFNFTFSSGRPFTAPQLEFPIQGGIVTYFFERNNARIPDYHRFDLGLTLDGSHRKDALLSGSWTLSIYNLYGRQNAYSVFVGDRKTSSPNTFKLSVLGTIFPSISYNFFLR